MNKPALFILFIPIIFSLIFACTSGRNMRIKNDDVILHTKLTDSIVIDLSNLSYKDNLLKHIKIEPYINASYKLDKITNKLFIIPDTKFEELTRYVVTLNYKRKKIKYKFLTSPDTYISLFNVKTKPKAWFESKTIKFEKDSIPKVIYKGKFVVNPTTIFQFALSCYEDYIQNNNQTSKLYFLKQVDFIFENNTVIGEGIGFKYDYDVSGMKAPWYSALAQGHAVSVLIRAYFLTSDKKYLNLARKSINYMVSKYPDGTLDYTSDSLLWLQEYPQKKPASVLNGFVFAIFGLVEYAKLFPEDTVVANISRNCLISLKKGIPFYDTGNWLFYDRERRSNVNYHYMGMQTYQMKQLYQATQDTVFINYYYKWEKYFNWDDWVSGKNQKKESEKIKTDKKELKKKELGKKKSGFPDVKVKSKEIIKPEINKPEIKSPEIINPGIKNPEIIKPEIKKAEIR